ncbi:plasmid mobilization relaxosome protein MobC [Lachnospiraceae bacterium KK002]
MRRRNKNVSVRMTEDEYAALTMRVAESGQTLQSFIINAVLGAKVSGREEVKELQKLNGHFADTNRQLRGMATNINQMAHVANGYGQIPQQSQLEQLHQELQLFRKEFDATWRLIRQLISLQKVMEPCGTVSNM